MGKRFTHSDLPLCSAWVPILWGKCRDLFTKNDYIPDLPYDIIINILTRLPAKCIFKLWQSKNLLLHDLTTTPHFTRTHLDGATPTIVVQPLIPSRVNEIKLFLFHGKATSFDLTCCSNADCDGPFTLWGSYDGFLLFRSSFGPFCILNPITREQVIVTSPSIYSYVCGFYFHPHRKEYELVCLLYLGNQVWDCQILNPRSKHRRSLGSCSFPPRRNRRPVFINATFYWMVDWELCSIVNGVFPSLSESILSLNIETGELRAMEVVEPFATFPRHRKDPELEFQLFEMEGELSLFGTSSSSTHGTLSTPEVGIWVFNCNKECWVKKHSIMSPDHEQQWSFRSYFRDFEYIKTRGEFIAYDRRDKEKQPLVYILRSGTWKSFERKGFERDRFVITTHTHSLVSLDAADPVISLLC